VDESDRRTVHLQLTQAAQFAAQLGRQAQEQFFAQLFRGFSDSDMARWRELNHKICHNITQLE
jgi:DNA-binding MarR family transcriptional regulator